jgi:hypothetical protein
MATPDEILNDALTIAGMYEAVTRLWPHVTTSEFREIVQAVMDEDSNAQFISVQDLLDGILQRLIAKYGPPQLLFFGTALQPFNRGAEMN